MKFRIYGREFKSLVDRISGIVPKRTAIRVLETVKITAYDKYVTVEANDLQDFATIKVYADIYEDGATWVYLTDLKKVIGIDDELTITTNDGKMEVRGAKKSYEIVCHDDYYEFWTVCPKLQNNNIMCRQNDLEFLNHLSRLNCMRSESTSNMMMTTFCLDLPKEKIVVLDGHRIGIAKLVGGMFSPNRKRLVIYGTLYKALKSLIGKSKIEKYIEIYADDKYALFVGEDWTLTTKLVEGQFFNYENLISVSEYDYTYKVNKKELGDIAKEYCKVVSEDNKKPMIIYNYCGKVATCIEVADYRTSDVIESVVPEYGMDHEFYVGFDPRFIADACNVFDNMAAVHGQYKANCPITITDETYTILILPVNIVGYSVEFVRKQVA